LSVVLKHLCPTCENFAEDALVLLPQTTTLMMSHIDYNGFEIINQYCGSELDTAKLYKIVSENLGEKSIFALNGQNYYVKTVKNGLDHCKICLLKPIVSTTKIRGKLKKIL
jgi:hypothetical protein